jgi:membrane-associated protease RseP (regulator of RpoE activity)
LLLAVLLLPATAWSLPPEGQFELRMAEGLFWLDANEAPVVHMLEEISRLTGIPIIYDPGNESVLTVHVEERDIETLIKAIAAGSMVLYAEDPKTGEYYIEGITTTTSVDFQTKRRQRRDQVVSQRRLDERLDTRIQQPLRYSGIGARIGLSDDGMGVWVRPITPNAPAARAGLAIGDLVTAIDGKPVTDFEHLGAISAAIRGPSGSTVVLRVKRPDGAVEEVPVKRAFYRYDPPRQQQER